MEEKLMEWARLVTLLDAPTSSTTPCLATSSPSFDAIARTYTDAASTAAFARQKGWDAKLAGLMEGNSGEMLGREVVLGLLALVAGTVL